MDYIDREIEPRLKMLASKFPVVSLTGPRQSGKSTLAKHAFPDYRYVSLEDPNARQFAHDDPAGFLATYGSHSIIDEIQRAPELFNYLQTKVDELDEAGSYVLSGSQDFMLMEGITQSLAGRAALLSLLPLSLHELVSAGYSFPSLDEWMLRGAYPRTYRYDIEPDDYFPSYVQTYLERDVRKMISNTSLDDFIRFIRLCAGRVGSILDIRALSSEASVDMRTVKKWLSILESGKIVFLLRPYFDNFNKRLVKRPKLYFCDTGLVCSLLGITSTETLSLSPFRGGIFENEMILEFIKRRCATGAWPNIWFWQETATNEVDLIIESQGAPQAIEMKSGATYKLNWFNQMKVFTELAGVDENRRVVVYGGDEDIATSRGKIISWRSWPEGI